MLSEWGQQDPPHHHPPTVSHSQTAILATPALDKPGGWQPFKDALENQEERTFTVSVARQKRFFFFFIATIDVRVSQRACK